MNKMETTKKSKKISESEKRGTKIAFNLLFPSLIITCIAAASGTVGSSLIAIVLFFYQAVLTKQYIDSQHN